MSEAVRVLFEGIRQGGEFWGGTQADFLLVPPSGCRREVSVVLSDGAASALAEKESMQNSEEFRADAAAAMGADYLEAALKAGRTIAPTVLVSASMVGG